MGIMILGSSVFEMKGGCPHRACPERANGLTPPAARLRVCSAERGVCRLGLSILLLLIMMAINAVRESAGICLAVAEKAASRKRVQQQGFLSHLGDHPGGPTSSVGTSARDTPRQSRLARGFGITIKPSIAGSS